jgi:hypothetical protein
LSEDAALQLTASIDGEPEQGASAGLEDDAASVASAVLSADGDEEPHADNALSCEQALDTVEQQPPGGDPLTFANVTGEPGK